MFQVLCISSVGTDGAHGATAFLELRQLELNFSGKKERNPSRRRAFKIKFWHHLSQKRLNRISSLSLTPPHLRQFLLKAILSSHLKMQHRAFYCQARI